MYGIFETTAFSKSRAFNNEVFNTLEEAQEKLAPICVAFEIDAANNAADFFTIHGGLFTVEAI